MSRIIWELGGSLLRRQKRRAQLVARYIADCARGNALDLGCGEGYATSFVSRVTTLVVGIDTDISKLQVAKSKLRKEQFICASIESLPLRNQAFDLVFLLEVLEHLTEELQCKGVQEMNRVLRMKGALIISVPYKEEIAYTRCPESDKLTPLLGHLHSLDERKVKAFLPTNYRLSRKTILPNLEMLSCSRIAGLLPLTMWLLVNKLLEIFKKGYWIVLMYEKSRYSFSKPYYSSIREVKVFSDHCRSTYEKEYSKSRAQREMMG